jgi:D-beta-D-heptose 7-phosphate kinase / D-beta-D-heptose 1-phosphate adenosyltransferase
VSIHLVVVGDALLDRDLEGTADRLCPDVPVPVVDEPITRSRPGGAGLAALLAAGDGAAVTLVTAVARDPAGRELATLLDAAGVEVVDLGLEGRTPEKVRVRAGGHAYLRLDYGGRRGGAIGPLPAAALAATSSADAVLVSDYGRGMTGATDVRALLTARARDVPVVWDPHPLGAAPVPGVRLATPNADEAARQVDDVAGDDLRAVTARAGRLRDRWHAGGVVVTLGHRGALLVGTDGTPLAVPAPPVDDGDPCGAGDRFAALAALRLAAGALPSEAVVDAVAGASAFVAAGGAGAAMAPGDVGSDAPRGPGGSTDAEALARCVRARGGTVVATGGCFDLLHAGHVAVLAAARRLGDCLIVCLNSDASVRRRKGPGRPVVGQQDRAAVLASLAAVDAVVTFDEDTPAAVLGRLRPHVWAKGADYAAADLPEAAVVERWGGQAVVLPYVPGRSTTALLARSTSPSAPQEILP